MLIYNWKGREGAQAPTHLHLALCICTKHSKTFLQFLWATHILTAASPLTKAHIGVCITLSIQKYIPEVAGGWPYPCNGAAP